MNKIPSIGTFVKRTKLPGKGSGEFSWLPHSFGRVVNPPEKMKNELEDYIDGVAVELICECMRNRGSIIKPWQTDECIVLTAREYNKLLLKHKESCNVKTS